MTKPIVLYDQNHERVGETYPRRAKQLLKSGRAVWLDEGQSMQICTDYQPNPPDKEDEISMTEPIYQNNGEPITEPVPVHPGESSDLLLYKAKRNVAEKRSLIRHLIAYIIAWPFLHALIFRFFNGGSRTSAQMDHATAIRMANDFMPSLQFRNFTTPYLFIQGPDGGSWGRVDSNAVNEVLVAFASDIQAYVPTAVQRHDFLWYFVLGVMVTWGVWIVARGIRVLGRHMNRKAPRALKPDPVAIEYQRLIASS